MKIDIKGFSNKPTNKDTAGIQFRLKTMGMTEYYTPQELSDGLYSGKTVVIDNVKLCEEENLYRNMKKNCINTRYIGIDIDADPSYDIQDIDDTEKLLEEIGIKWSFRYKTFSYDQPEKVNVKDENGKNVKDEYGNIVKVETGRIKKNHRYIIHVSESLTPYEALGFYKYIERKFSENNTPLDKACTDLVRLWYGGPNDYTEKDTPYDTMYKSDILQMAQNELLTVSNYFDDNYTKRKLTKARTRGMKNRSKIKAIKEKRAIKISDGYLEPDFENDFKFYDFEISSFKKVNKDELIKFIDDSVEEWVDYTYMRNVMLSLTIFESLGEITYMNHFIDSLEEQYKDQYMYYVMDARSKQYITREAIELFNRFIIDNDDIDNDAAKTMLNLFKM